MSDSEAEEKHSHRTVSRVRYKHIKLIQILVILLINHADSERDFPQWGNQSRSSQGEKEAT